MRACSVLSLGKPTAALDLVFLDPPYATGAGDVALDKLARLGWIGPQTWISLETAMNESPTLKGFTVEAERKVGKARITLAKLSA